MIEIRGEIYGLVSEMHAKSMEINENESKMNEN